MGQVTMCRHRGFGKSASYTLAITFYTINPFHASQKCATCATDMMYAPGACSP
jgi:hypothetical protein